MERFSHLGKCAKIRETFEPLIRLVRSHGVAVSDVEAYIYLGHTDEGPLNGGLSALHVIVWKFLIIDFVQVDLGGRVYDPKSVWRAALCRLPGKKIGNSCYRKY